MSQKILLFSPQQSARLHYVIDFIFTEQLNLEFEITSDLTYWKEWNGAKINYSQERQGLPGEIYIKAGKLLFETDVQELPLNIGRWKHTTILFYNQPGGLVPFDFFSAVFYLISRYEEYLPHQKDPYGRYPAVLSAAGQYSFIDTPVIDFWIFHLKKILRDKFSIEITDNEFSFRPSFDIDIAYAYLHRPRSVQLGGLAKSAVKLNLPTFFERVQVISGMKSDPFDSYDYLTSICQLYNYYPIFFFLVSDGGVYDKNLPLSNKEMPKLIKRLASAGAIGLHPSFDSNENSNAFYKELSGLSEVLENKTITKSRQHYIKLKLPDTYQTLIDAGIKEDYSMGYPEVNGFRASTSYPFYWFDLSTNEVTNLRIYPFAFMDATSIFYEKLSVKEAIREGKDLIDKARAVNAPIMGIFHNHFIGKSVQHKAWQAYFKTLLQYAATNHLGV